VETPNSQLDEIYSSERDGMGPGILGRLKKLSGKMAEFLSMVAAVLLPSFKDGRIPQAGICPPTGRSEGSKFHGHKDFAVYVNGAVLSFFRLFQARIFRSVGFLFLRSPLRTFRMGGVSSLNPGNLMFLRRLTSTVDMDLMDLVTLFIVDFTVPRRLDHHPPWRGQGWEEWRVSSFRGGEGKNQDGLQG